jgi:hypothetical protein
MTARILVVASLWLGVAKGFAQAPFFGSENFAGASKDVTKWGDNISGGPALLSQSGGVLKFTNSAASVGDDDHFMAWPWKMQGPMLTSWSVQADVNVPVIPLPDAHAAVGMGVVVRNGSDGRDVFAMMVENYRSPGQAQRYHFLNSVDVKDAGHSELFQPAATGRVLSVRIVWNADTQTLSAQYDHDGPVNGYTWQTLNTYNPIALGGWEMGPLDTFEVAVVGSAEKTVVASSRNVYLDNFLTAPVTPANLAGSDNFNDGSRDLAKWGQDVGSPNHVLSEVNGRLEFTNNSTNDGSAQRPWIANSGSFTDDWEAFVDVHVSNYDWDDGELAMVLAAKTPAGSAEIRLGLVKAAGVAERLFSWSSQGPAPDGGTAPAPGEDASLRVAFTAADKVLRFYYDADGSTGGYEWIALGAVDVDDTGSDWGMTDEMRFQVTLEGVSREIPVPSGDAYADNFVAVRLVDPVISGPPNSFDLFTTPGRSPQKWGEIIENGTAELSQSGDGVVRFAADASAQNDDSMEAWIWQSNGSFSSSWSAQVDVNVPFIALAPGHTAVGLGLAVLNSADPEDNFTAGLENYRATGQPQEFHFLSTLDINGVSAPETFAPASSTLASVRVAWDHKTKLLTAAYDADGPLNGYSWTVFKTFSPVGAASWNMTASNSFRIALYGSAEETEVTLSHGLWADNFYIFGTTTTVLPVVKNGMLTGLSHNSVNVNGSVDEKGSQRAVYIDWGTTDKFGNTKAASPAITDGTSNTIIVGELTGLMPHTKYHCRIRATNALGTATGANMTFTTLNRNPAGVADEYTLLPGAVVSMNVLGNDADPDGDALSLKSNTAVIPANAGKLAKSGNKYVFTAGKDFAGTSFTYTAADAFGGASAPVTVTLAAGSCQLSHSQVFPLPSAGVWYDVDVTSDGWWSVTKNQPWIAVTPASGEGDGKVTITLQPNAALAARTGTVVIGGQSHVITQAGVIQPDISLDVDPPPPAIVGGGYLLQINIQNAPVTFTVTGMPPGLTLNQNTGVISGRPTKAGAYRVIVKAKNAAGAAPTVLDFMIHVAPLNSNFVGVFHGLVDSHPDINGGFGSRLELTITGKGGITGKLITGGTTRQIVGNLEPDVNDGNAATFMLPSSGPNQTSLNLSFNGMDGTVSGTVDDFALIHSAPVGAWRNPWTTVSKATAYAGRHNFSLEPPTGDPFVPEGFGFGTFTPNATTGAVTLTGKLPDDTTVTTSTFVGPAGQVLIYSPLYGNTGVLAGTLQVLANDEGTLSDNEVTGQALWFKLPPMPPNPKDTVYPFGIPPVPLTVGGSDYPGIPPGGLVLGLTPPQGVVFGFSGGQLVEENVEFSVEAAIANPSSTGTTNKFTFPSDEVLNPNKVTITKIDTATGAFTGEFTLPGATLAENRKVQFFGQIARDPFEGWVGRGYCLVPVPIFPPFITAANAMKFSSRVGMAPGP